MAKKHSNKESSASLIFTWVLIILLAVGAFFITKNYGDTHTNIMKNTAIVQYIAEQTGRNVGDITVQDIADIEAISVSSQLDINQLMQPDGTISFSSSQELPYVNYVTLCLKGYTDTFNNEGSEAADKYLVSYLGDFDSLKDDFSLFTGIKTFELVDYTSDNVDFDLEILSPDVYKNIEKITVYGYNVKNFANVAGHKNLKSLSVSEINDEDLAVVKDITTLESLYVEGTDITDASVVENLTSLKSLTVSGTSIKSIPSLEKLVNLEEVDFSYNDLTDIAPLASLNADKIKNVAIVGNKIEDFSPISHIAEDKVEKDVPEEETEEADDAE